MNPKVALRIEKWNYILGGIMSLVGFITLPVPQALGFFVGAVLSAVNFSILRRLVSRIMEGVASGKGYGTSLLFIPKMAALLAGLAAVLLLSDASPVYVAIGFSVFFLSIAIETIRFLFSTPQQGSENG